MVALFFLPPRTITGIKYIVIYTHTHTLTHTHSHTHTNEHTHTHTRTRTRTNTRTHTHKRTRINAHTQMHTWKFLLLLLELLRLLLQLMPILAQCDAFLRTSFSGTGSLRCLCFNGVAKTAQALDTKGDTPDGIAWQFESFLEKGAVLRRESERGGGATFKQSA